MPQTGKGSNSKQALTCALYRSIFSSRQCILSYHAAVPAGVYVKSNPSCDPGESALISNILYENVNVTKPSWYAIWIGPQQQHEPNQALGNKCALTYPIINHCPTQGCVTFNNITLRNIKVGPQHI